MLGKKVKRQKKKRKMKPDDYFKNCYSFLDYDDKINAYNLKYNLVWL